MVANEYGSVLTERNDYSPRKFCVYNRLHARHPVREKSNKDFPMDFQMVHNSNCFHKFKRKFKKEKAYP